MDFTFDVRPVGPLRMNAVLVTSPGTGEAVLIDPGDEPAQLLAWVKASGCRVTALLATHGHFDHVGAAAEVGAALGLPLRCHPDDAPMIRQMPLIQEGYGFPATAVPTLVTDLVDGARVPLGDGFLEVVHVPGHAMGEVMFVLPGLAIVGDCLFAGSVGRTDLPGGDFATLEKSIRERIYTLPDATIVVSGHGPDTTVGREKATNPYVRG
ncbi:MAG: MBL fold metallo-hydrolase [bacterium]|nr:MBL fold metallo-hydrolase [bacterium]MBK7188263.1 MBL fold metallo-hydrolase [bacterium]MBK7770250.1 MBL fold metallo-hydrolase [bacterium]MBK9473261.1 MBL fold metallo-hydrolase [bacterium]